MPGFLSKWKAANLKIEPTENPNEVYVYAPDDIRLEVYGVPDPLSTAVPDESHSLFRLRRSWDQGLGTSKAFASAIPGQRPCIACLSRPRMFESGDLPGVNLTFGSANTPQAPTKGRGIDHIGFEVTNLDEFVKTTPMRKGSSLEVPIRQIPNTKTKIAFLTDPWGTYIELTEGIAPPQ